MYNLCSRLKYKLNLHCIFLFIMQAERGGVTLDAYTENILFEVDLIFKQIIRYQKSINTPMYIIKSLLEEEFYVQMDLQNHCGLNNIILRYLHSKLTLLYNNAAAQVNK